MFWHSIKIDQLLSIAPAAQVLVATVWFVTAPLFAQDEVIEVKPPLPSPDQLWRQATAEAEQQNWQAAIRAGKQAYVAQNKQVPEQPAEIGRMLAALSYWHARAREFPAAQAAARELLYRRRQIYSDEYWQTIDARLNLELVERLSQLNDAQWKKFLEADQFGSAAATLQGSSQPAKAIVKAKSALSIYEELLGRDHPLSHDCLAVLAACHLQLGQFGEAQPLINKMMELQPNPKGWVHPDSLQWLKLLANYNAAVGDLATAEQAWREVVKISALLQGESHPDTAMARVELAKTLTDLGKLDEAQTLLTIALAQLREQLGDDHAATAQAMKILGALLAERGKFDDARPLLDRSVTIFQKFAGEQHVATASALNARGRMHLLAENYQPAYADLSASLAICEKALGKEHPTNAKVLDNLAQLYERGANFGLARQLRLKCLKIAEQSYGETNVLTADALEQTARLYVRSNDFALAEPYLLRARETRRKLLGEQHPLTANVMGLLAYVYLGVGETALAEPLFHEALAAFAVSQGADSLDAAKIHERLALLCQSEDRLAEAERHYRQALAIWSNHQADAMTTANVKVGLAQTLLSRGEVDDAIEPIEQVLTAYDKRLHPRDPQWFDVLGVGGMVYLAAEKPDRARQLIERGLQIAKLRLQMSGGFESERQKLTQLRFMRNMLDLYLSLPADSHSDNAQLYGHALEWKGAVATSQWRDRQAMSAAESPELLELRQTVRQLAALNLHAPAPDLREAWIRDIFDLTMRKEQLEQQLAADIAGRQGAPSAVEVAQLQALLNPDTALIDILEYTHTVFKVENGVLKRDSRPRYVAFILHGQGDIERIDLGDAEPIADAVAQWQKSRGFRPNAGKTDWAATVGSLVWAQLQPHVADDSTLLISPDGMLSQLAWNALPGKGADRYLIEDFAIGIVPVPQLLAAKALATPRAAPAAEASLLLVGNVDYDALDSTAEQAGTARSQFRFGPLPGTADEVQSLSQLFRARFPQGKVELLEQASATEQALWDKAPRHRWLHLATHGFFAPANVRTALVTQNRMGPGRDDRQDISFFNRDYLNGVALTGANLGPREKGEDGILTAAELALMQLGQVEVVVLAGCETGLGDPQPGDGPFGMQRALQIAGVGATIGSFWTVSDQKTNLLMQRFYRNLWDKQLGTLAALREAQLWLLNTNGTADAAKPAKRGSPHYWAAFTLSGNGLAHFNTR